MRYVILAILVYLAYLIIRNIMRNVLNKDKTRVENGNKNKTRRQYDLNKVQDAEFREVKKD